MDCCIYADRINQPVVFQYGYVNASYRYTIIKSRLTKVMYVPKGIFNRKGYANVLADRLDMDMVAKPQPKFTLMDITYHFQKLIAKTDSTSHQVKTCSDVLFNKW